MSRTAHRVGSSVGLGSEGASWGQASLGTSPPGQASIAMTGTDD